MTATPGPGAPNTSNAQPHHGSVANKLNWLRAAVLGANDGIVSTAGIVIGVAAATVERGPVLTAGIAGLAAGALSMAVGEYVSVSTQRDTERALLETETQELKLQPDAELDELAALYEARGLSAETARQAATELTAHDPLAAHAELELRLDPEQLTNPWLAADLVGRVVHDRRTTATHRDSSSARVDAHRGHRRRGAARAGDHRLGGCPARWRKTPSPDPARDRRRRAGHGDHIRVSAISSA